MSKLAWVTGASRGIGAAVADRLKQDGLTVVGTATTQSGAAAIAQKLGGGFQLDLGAPDLEDRIKAMLDEHGSPQVLVNNAGIVQIGLFPRLSTDEWTKVLNVNLTANVVLCRLVLRAMMRARWGRIINMGSVVGSMGLAGQTAYAASKAGLAGFSRSLAQEVGARGITVNTVEPGFIATDMTEGIDEGVKVMVDTSVPAKRMGTAEEVAALVSFLASEESSYITGARLPINGGLYMD